MRIVFLSLLAGSMAAFAACSSTGSSGNPFNNTGGSSNSGGSSSGGSSNGGSSNGGTSSSGGSGFGGSINYGGSTGTGGSGGLTPDAACASSKQQAAEIPVDIYAMIDISGSMQGAKWASVKQALTTFVNDPSSKGIGLGIQYFPGSPECQNTTYSTPAVPIATLPGNAQAIISSLGGQFPNGGTPTKPALAGALLYAKSYKTQNPTHAVVVVLATDGEPNDCLSSVANVEGVATLGNSTNSGPPIETYVIGVGASLGSLNGIAAAGGTQQAFIVNGGNVTQFTQAMDAIRGAATLPCTYQMPTPPAGQTIDPNKVNVEFTGSNGQTTNLLQVADASQCTSSGGWYYDNPSNPTQIKLCPTTCSTVTADPKGQVNVLLGCQTTKQPPH